MQVADVMHTDVKTADAEDTFADVAKTMRATASRRWSCSTARSSPTS